MGMCVCSKSGQEKSRYTYPLPATSGAGEIFLLHAGWAGKYAGQATMSYGAGGLLAGANGVMVPMGRFFDPAGSASTSALAAALGFLSCMPCMHVYGLDNARYECCRLAFLVTPNF